LKIRAFAGWPGGGRAWADEELALIGTDHDEAIAARIGRTTGAVSQKRAARKVPTFRDRRRGSPALVMNTSGGELTSGSQ
jgi:transcriptional regulator GlxA family with amidase domain